MEMSSFYFGMHQQSIFGCSSTALLLKLELHSTQLMEIAKANEN